MLNTYVIWWHSKFIDEIDKETLTFTDIIEKTTKIVMYLQDLQKLETTGKISIKPTGSLNPIYLDLIDPTVEAEVAKNPLVETLVE